jgi:hypothetical protein
MRKLLFVAVATALIAAQPSFVQAQTTTTYPTVNILQTIPVEPLSDGLPAGVTGTRRCFVGSADGAVGGDDQTIHYVGNVLCIDPGPSGTFDSWASNCPEGSEAVIQGVKLIKTVPTIPKCPDIYPGGVFVQTPMSTGIRTWWPLKHTPCETTFRLEIEFGCVGPDPNGIRRILEVRRNVYTFKVVVTPDTLSWVVDALHNQPLGVCEVPCITDEALFATLYAQAEAIGTAAAGLPGSVLTLNRAIDTMEATVVNRCLFVLSAWQIGDDGAVVPCALFPDGGPWGNFTVGDFGFGIVDTLENPCCCKLVSDLYWLKLHLIGNDP